MADVTAATHEEPESGDAQASLRTGIADQWLVVSGWGASHADAGTPGPHVHLSTNDRGDPVLKTSQIPALVDALNTVGGRIDRMWEEDGDTWFTGDEPDFNDPEVRRQRHVADLELHTLIAERWTEVAKILWESADTDEAIERIAPLLGVDEVQVLTRLARFSLFTVTRGARAARERTLRDLREL